MWNKLTEEVRTADSVYTFKSNTAPQKESQVLYYYGERWLAIHHARLRIGCSKLNSDLCHNLHVIDDPACACGSPLENADHFLFHCPQFQNERVLMLNELQGVMPINVPNLLFGNALYNADANQRVFMAVHQFIINSHRFD